MPSLALPYHRGLADSSRFPVLAERESQARLAEILWLLFVGVAAGCATAFLDFGLRIPGHAIVRAILPMAFGLAVAPRRMAGTVMATGALGSALTIHIWGPGGIGAGAMTSLALTGPLLDLALWRAGHGLGLYIRFAVWGLASNMAALAVRAGFKLTGLEPMGKRPFFEWFPQASVTYAVCGLLAGLFSAWICFRFTRPRSKDREETAA